MRYWFPLFCSDIHHYYTSSRDSILTGALVRWTDDLAGLHLGIWRLLGTQAQPTGCSSWLRIAFQSHSILHRGGKQTLWALFYDRLRA